MSFLGGFGQGFSGGVQSGVQLMGLKNKMLGSQPEQLGGPEFYDAGGNLQMPQQQPNVLQQLFNLFRG